MTTKKEYPLNSKFSIELQRQQKINKRNEILFVTGTIAFTLMILASAWWA